MDNNIFFVVPRGIRGIGIARFLAKSFVCAIPSRRGMPCDKCEVCRAISCGVSREVLDMKPIAVSTPEFEHLRAMMMAERNRGKIWLLDSRGGYGEEWGKLLSEVRESFPTTKVILLPGDKEISPPPPGIRPVFVYSYTQVMTLLSSWAIA